MGVGFRLFRVILSSITYFIIFVVFLAVYGLWCLLPLFIFNTF